MGTVSTDAFTGDPALYTDEQWQEAAVLDKGEDHAAAKDRYGLPVREPDGTLNLHGLEKAASALTGPLDLSERMIERAQASLARRYTVAGLPVRADMTKAQLGAAERNDLPDSAFAYVEPGGTKDSGGRTTPRSKRHFPVHDAAHVRAAVTRIAQGAKFSHEAKPKVTAAAKKLGVDVAKSEVDRVVPLWKDDAKRVVYGVALTPGLTDSQGDEVSAEEIEKAAHKFLTDYRKHDIQHSEQPAGVETVESFIAPQDMVIAGQPVKKGSWVMGTHISDDAVWDRVCKGELTGYSTGGTGERFDLAA